MTHDDGWVFPLLLMLMGGSSGGEGRKRRRSEKGWKREERREKREGATMEGVAFEEEKGREMGEGGERVG